MTYILASHFISKKVIFAATTIHSNWQYTLLVLEMKPWPFLLLVHIQIRYKM